MVCSGLQYLGVSHEIIGPWSGFRGTLKSLFGTKSSLISTTRGGTATPASDTRKSFSHHTAAAGRPKIGSWDGTPLQEVVLELHPLSEYVRFMSSAVNRNVQACPDRWNCPDDDQSFANAASPFGGPTLGRQRHGTE